MKKIVTICLIVAVLAALCACAGPSGVSASSKSAVIDKDRAGNDITLPKKIDKVIALGPSNNEELIALGCADKIIAADEYSANIPGLPEGIPMFSILTPDGEQIINLNPDVIFATGMSIIGGDDPFQVVKDAGICVVYIPSSYSIEGIKEDIRFMAAVMGKQARGAEIVKQMEKDIAAVQAVAKTIKTPKKVYMEVGAPPYMVSMGKNTFMHEMIELIGATNILGDQDGWISVTDEAILEANPDVILTSVNYIDDPIGDVYARSGWDEITAIKNKDVYYIDTDSSNRPSHNVVKAMKEMAKAVYPDKY